MRTGPMTFEKFSEVFKSATGKTATQADYNYYLDLNNYK